MTTRVTCLHELDLSRPAAARNEQRFDFGSSRSPQGLEIAADGVSLLENGRRVMPVMGEIHYARLPPAEWRGALLKMKAGGITIAASYVFWIFHEEQRGRWNWSGQRDLRAFVIACGDAGLRCIVRIGPWCHGEVRNGGLPEWLFDQGIDVRTTSPRYLEAARRFYAAVADQLRGLLWKDGGPVIGIQIENEYGGEPEHLLALKRLAIDAGLDVPLYTRTGWPELKSPMPFGELLPLFGGYAEGFWDRALETMPGHYWKEFIFKKVRSDAAIASEHFGLREVEDAPDVANYPYLTCEIGPGMASSYHRRITVFPMDVLSMVIVKLGSGSNSPGYYMYHGGTNPAGAEPCLQEHQATRYTNWNDMPVKSYDFQTCLGEFGQIREQYHLLRPLHLFLEDFGDRLANLPAVIPEPLVTRGDGETFRWAVRSDGRSGFVFINNYHRLQPLPARQGVQLKLKTCDGEISFPKRPTTIPADTAFFWPFTFDLGDGITLDYATAQPICQVRNAGQVWTFFASTGDPAEFSLSGFAKRFAEGVSPEGGHGVLTDVRVLTDVEPGTAPFATLAAKNAAVHHLVLLDETRARQMYRGEVGGKTLVVICPGNVVFDGSTLRLSTTTPQSLPLLVFPPPAAVEINGQPIEAHPDGAFQRFRVPFTAKAEALTPTVTKIRSAGPARQISLGAKGVASAPTDRDFNEAAEWLIRLPLHTDPARNLLFRIHYTGDVARAYIGERLVTDHFYNGAAFEVGLQRHAEAAISSGIRVKILPLRKDAPIYLLDRVRPDFGGDDAIAELTGVEVLETLEAEIKFPAAGKSEVCAEGLKG